MLATLWKCALRGVRMVWPYRLDPEELARFAPRPICCEDAGSGGDKSGNHVPFIALLVDLFGDQRPPRWIFMGVTIKFCPFCGAVLPEVELVVDPSVKVTVCTDGGYYCDTCSKRLMGCECARPATLYKLKDRLPAPCEPAFVELLARHGFPDCWIEPSGPDGWYLRYDTLDRTCKEQDSVCHELQDNLRALGWEIGNPYVEHDCISGKLKAFVQET